MFKLLEWTNRFVRETVNLDKEEVGYSIFVLRAFIQTNSESQDQSFPCQLLLMKPKKSNFKPISLFPPLENKDESKNIPYSTAVGRK